MGSTRRAKIDYMMYHSIYSCLLVLIVALVSPNVSLAQGNAPAVFHGLKGIRLGMTKEAALKAASDLTLGVAVTCRVSSVYPEESCTSASIPATNGVSFARAPLHYIAFTLENQRVSEVRISVGDSGSPVRDMTIGELGETLSAATGEKAAIYSTSMSDVTMVWYGPGAELWLDSNWEKPQGVSIMVMLRKAHRTPEAFSKRKRNDPRFVNDL